MKINGHNPYSKIEPARPVSEHSRAEDQGSSVASGGAAAEVRMSDTAHALRDARAPEQPDPAKVERLRAAIARGELRIDPDKIAARMLEEER